MLTTIIVAVVMAAIVGLLGFTGIAIATAAIGRIIFHICLATFILFSMLFAVKETSKYE